MSNRYRRADGIAERQIDGEIFLISAENQSLFHLNALAAAIWNLLERPLTINEAVEITGKAFPDMPGDAISNDVEKLIKRLAANNLVTRIG
ncbi:MAG TPA: PqqD family protein [Alphaproteobacteria bacterium]|nr:PqqD family protein [Alphaproteobacteria bacterium]